MTMSTQQLHVKNLVSSTVTRARGEEAFANLERFLEQGPLELLLDGVELLSTSFLDEIVRLLASRGEMDKMTFVTNDVLAVGKLARISALRRVPIYTRAAHDARRTLVVPKQLSSGDSTFAPTKVPADGR